MLKCFSLRPELQFISLILFVYQKHTLILVLLQNSILEIYRNKLVRSDRPSNNIRGDVCIYYKSFLPLKILNVQYLLESICFKLKIGDKTCGFLSLYRSPSQSQDEFESFPENLELNLQNLVRKNSFLVVTIGDCNAKSSNWFCQGKTNFERDAIENLTPQFGLHQVIKEQTHILDTSTSCIAQIFTLQPNLIIGPEFIRFYIHIVIIR